MTPYRIDDDCLTLFVRLTPKGGRDGLDGIEQSADGKVWLKARVRAVPEDGKANAALEAMLAKTFNVSKSAVKVVSGHTARNKHIEVAGDADALLTRFNQIVEPMVVIDK